MTTMRLRLAATAMAVLVINCGSLSHAGPPPVNVPVISHTVHNNWNNYGGNMMDLINGSGMNGTNYPADQPSWPPVNTPDTWYSTSGDYHDEWQSEGKITNGINSKIGWAIFDFGSPQGTLADLYMWNLRQSSSDTKQYNIYYAISPSVTPPSPPADGQECL